MEFLSNDNMEDFEHHDQEMVYTAAAAEASVKIHNIPKVTSSPLTEF